MLVKMGVKGVDLSFLSPHIWEAIKIISDIWGEEDMIITSTGEGTHLNHSKHYQNQAIDVRPSVFFFNNNTVKAVLQPLGYDVIIKPDHIHIEYDPKE